MIDTKPIRLTECPRDAMQGMKEFIPTATKVNYLNSLLKVGFDILDFGSFVSPKAIPQLKDTAEVVKKLELSGSKTKLLAIVGNMRGAELAAEFDEISYIGFPFSISDTFLRMNINSNLDKAFGLCKELLERCDSCEKELMIYLSMGFGNPYQDPWSVDLVVDWVSRLQEAGAREINLSDTIGVAQDESVSQLYKKLVSEFPGLNFGLHLHARYDDWYTKIDAAFDNGCRSFDAVLTGMGGCPMTGYELVGNIQMSKLITHFESRNIPLDINKDALLKSLAIAQNIFN